MNLAKIEQKTCRKHSSSQVEKCRFCFFTHPLPNLWQPPHQFIKRGAGEELRFPNE